MNIKLLLCFYMTQATMLKKNKIKRRLTEPNIHPSNGDGGGSKTNADE